MKVKSMQAGEGVVYIPYKLEIEVEDFCELEELIELVLLRIPCHNWHILGGYWDEPSLMELDVLAKKEEGKDIYIEDKFRPEIVIPELIEDLRKRHENDPPGIPLTKEVLAEFSLWCDRWNRAYDWKLKYTNWRKFQHAKRKRAFNR